MKLLITAAAYFAAFVVVATVAFGVLMGLANSQYGAWLGAHGLGGSLLGILGWGIVLVLPAFFARFVWRYLSKQAPPKKSG